jgi:hypothetical protein
LCIFFGGEFAGMLREVRIATEKEGGHARERRKARERREARTRRKKSAGAGATE